jgi:hypothetical protein
MISLPFFSLLFFFHFLVAVVSHTHYGENSSYSLSTTKQPAITPIFLLMNLIYSAFYVVGVMFLPLDIFPSYRHGLYLQFKTHVLFRVWKICREPAAWWHRHTRDGRRPAPCKTSVSAVADPFRDGEGSSLP